MRPSSVVSRAVPQAHPYFPVEAERPGPGVMGQILRGGILAGLLALAVGAPGQGASAPTETETRLTPAGRVVELPFEPFVAPGPAAEAEPKEQPRAQANSGTVAPRQVAPSGGGGDTNVTYDNGTNDTDTSSGGSHVTNDSNLHSRAGVDTGQQDPEEEDPQP